MELTLVTTHLVVTLPNYIVPYYSMNYENFVKIRSLNLLNKILKKTYKNNLELCDWSFGFIHNTKMLNYKYVYYYRWI